MADGESDPIGLWNAAVVGGFGDEFGHRWLEAQCEAVCGFSLVVHQTVYQSGYTCSTDDSGAYRVVYVARRADAVYVLHAFHKKTQATSKQNIERAKKRLAELLRGEQ